MSVAHVTPERQGVLKGKDLKPGDLVSMDQCVCQVKGQLPWKQGGEQESLQHSGGTIFVDHATGFVYLVHQVSFTAVETINAQVLFEQEMGRAGIRVKHYHSDNGIFKSEDFKASIEENGQELTLSGAYAHHQNGVAERYYKR